MHGHLQFYCLVLFYSLEFRQARQQPTFTGCKKQIAFPACFFIQYCPPQMFVHLATYKLRPSRRPAIVGKDHLVVIYQFWTLTLKFAYAQILLHILSSVESPKDLWSYFCTHRGAQGLAADPMLMACWLTKNRQPEAVDLAARKGGADVIYLLRMGGVSATEQARYASFLFNITPIEIAAEENLPEVVTYLLSRNDVRSDVAGVASALHSAADLNHVECLQAFLAPNSPVNANSLNCRGYSPLHSAALNANLEAIQLLLSRGAVCTLRDHHGSTPLTYVCEHADEGAVRAQILVMLLESGGDSEMNAQNKYGNTPLHLAVSANLPECCEVLLRAGSQASLPPSIFTHCRLHSVIIHLDNYSARQ